MMKLLKRLFIAALPVILWMTFTNSAFALGLMPGKVVVDASPGETVERSIRAINPEETPNLYDFVPTSYILREDGNQTFLNPDQPKPPYSAESWIEIDTETPLSIPANDEIEVPIKFNIPEDATPGTHLAAVSLTKAATITDGGQPVGVGVAGRVFLLVEVNVAGDVEAALELTEFFVDEDSLKNGILSFVATFKNEGNVAVAPMGNINIFDEEGTQVKNIIRITEELGGETITKGFKDTVAFNPSLSSAYPNITKDIKTKVDGLNLKPGKYKAKLAAYYTINEESINFEEEAEFTITEEVLIQSFSAPAFQSGLPVMFDGTILNNSSNLVSGNATIEIKNIFGIVKETINLSPGGYKILPGASLELSENATWDSGLALGYYSADLTFAYNDGANIISENVSFWVISWWQAIIVIVLLLIIIFGIYKGASKYSSMKKKLKEMEDK